MTVKNGVDLEQPALIALAQIYGEGIARPVFWTGAGLSQPAGLPSWLELRNILVKAARDKARTFEKAEADKFPAQISAILQLKDYWKAFDLLYDLLKKTSYTDEIRGALNAADRANIPRAYLQMWKLKIDGVVSLNLDRLATRAAYATPHINPIEFSGYECGKHQKVFKLSRPFIVNMHGILDETVSWVFRSRELTHLQSSEEYKHFISALFSAKTVVFVGISADDQAAGGLLHRLTSLGIDLGTHYWITSRRDKETDDWAEAAGLRVIRYQATTQSDHQQALETIFNELERFTPTDTTPPPVISPLNDGSESLLPSDALSKELPETIRYQLNSAARRVIDSDIPPYEKFREFCVKYERPIHYSWHVSTSPPDNVFFGYQLEQEIGAGAFGTVYRAKSENGATVAIKLLRQEVRNDEKMLGSFRRGVASMRILSNHNVQGMVEYHEAFELPPCVIMDYVEGETLEAAIDNELIKELSDILDVALKVARIVRTAHLLPERVLHRDIRPSNIMIRDIYSCEDNNWDVVVLDFDLSWHKNALEKSISTHATTALGYLAPEQISRQSKYTSRHTAVDSFGLAMSIFYMIGQRHPTAGESQSKHWDETVYKASRQHPDKNWKCLSERVARLIISATDVSQEERPDFSEVCRELEKLSTVSANSNYADSAEIWAEELFLRAYTGKEYKWDEDITELSASFVSGVALKLKPNEKENLIELKVSYTQTGSESYKNVDKYLPGAVEQATRSLTKSSWKVMQVNKASREAMIWGQISISDLVKNKDHAVEALASLGSVFSFQ